MEAPIDWDVVRERLATAQARLAGVELTDEQREAIFAQRAAELAVPAPTEAAVDGLEVLVFALGTERYAVPSVQVREVRPLQEITVLPGTPDFVAGIINVRGRVLPVLDLRPLFRLPADEAARTTILLAGAHGTVGVLATDQPAVRRLREAELKTLSAGGSRELDPTHVRGVTSDLIIVLDAERLLTDRRLVVEQDSTWKTGEE